jgi:hypothetical protein
VREEESEGWGHGLSALSELAQGGFVNVAL